MDEDQYDVYESGGIIKFYEYVDYSTRRIDTFINRQWAYIHADAVTKAPIKYFRRIKRKNDNVLLYYRFRYDEMGRINYFSRIGKGGVYDNVREFIHLEYDDASNIISHRDNWGNEWRKEWGIPNPFGYLEKRIHSGYKYVAHKQYHIHSMFKKGWDSL